LARVCSKTKSKIEPQNHVPRGTKEQLYLPKYTKSTLMSAGETPLMRDACDMVTG
jgi:hypothetical protein